MQKQANKTKKSYDRFLYQGKPKITDSGLSENRLLTRLLVFEHYHCLIILRSM